MCGIVGYTGARPCREILLAGLEKLEYRGYDSAGISLVHDGEFDSVRAVGNLAALKEAINGGGPANGAVAGIGHTRWATHGRVTEANCHPHDDASGRVHVVMNGIVENWADLKAELVKGGAEFTSDTDTEVIAHLIAQVYGGDIVEAVRVAYGRLRGHYAFVVIHADEPDVLVGARKECPLVVGVGEGENFIASAIPAFLVDTRRMQLVENDEIVVVTPGGTRFLDADGGPVERDVEEVHWDQEAAEKAGYETFMLKEIHEQPDAVAETVADRLAHGEVELGDIGISDSELRELRRVVIVACGTSYHAGLLGRYAIEAWSRVPVEMDVASEFRYRDPVIDERDLVIGITQSGETADTLAAMRLAREKGARVLAVTNVMGSQATRDSDGVLYTRAGMEVSVAATKTFVAQVAAMYLLGLKLATVRGTLERERLDGLIAELRSLPDKIRELLESVKGPVQAMADHWRDAGFFLYLGRHAGLGVALEGALKLREISYVPTDAYAAGEMKHGPIALLDERTPVVCVATDSPVLDKVLSNISEARARGAHVLAVATEGNAQVAEHAEEVVYVPRTDPLLQPLLAVIPLQLLAYGIARGRGLNVDQPRNLAKTVTVE
ncbi:MAG TPA: glutamine--fructose-6-phosphate transaminase (isomerizing) [Thermoleophilaceae bacterium]|nr:glutamine--fructose-6-phosphate transaminase (isomerizing) [Thermoleophilaceae bacterium]